MTPRGTVWPPAARLGLILILTVPIAFGGLVSASAARTPQDADRTARPQPDPATSDAPAGADRAAAAESGEGGAGADDSEAVELLRRASVSAHTVSYAGTKFVSSWSEDRTVSALVDVRHTAGQGTVVRHRSADSGEVAEFFAGDGDQAAVDLGDGQGPVELLAGSYTVRGPRPDYVVGRPASIVEALREDSSVAARLWLDDETGLLVRREVYDLAGRTVRAGAYIDLRPGDSPYAGHVPLSRPRTAVLSLGRDALPSLDADGWRCPSSLGARLRLYDVGMLHTAQGDALHLSYSDGLSTVSVFQIPGRLDRSALAAQGYRDVDGRLVPEAPDWARARAWESSGVVYTVLADAPSDVLEEALAALPAPDPAPVREERGVFDRLGRGLSRLGASVNPFD